MSTWMSRVGLGCWVVWRAVWYHNSVCRSGPSSKQRPVLAAAQQRKDVCSSLGCRQIPQKVLATPLTTPQPYVCQLLAGGQMQSGQSYTDGVRLACGPGDISTHSTQCTDCGNARQNFRFALNYSSQSLDASALHCKAPMTALPICSQNLADSRWLTANSGHAG